MGTSSGAIYRGNVGAEGATECNDLTCSALGPLLRVRAGARARGLKGGRGGGQARWGRTQQLGSSREFPSVGARGRGGVGALCYRRPLRLHRNTQVPDGWWAQACVEREREREGDRMRSRAAGETSTNLSLAEQNTARAGAVHRQTSLLCLGLLLFRASFRKQSNGRSLPLCWSWLRPVTVS